jgi:hypothetical protein
MKTTIAALRRIIREELKGMSTLDPTARVILSHEEAEKIRSGGVPSEDTEATAKTPGQQTPRPKNPAAQRINLSPEEADELRRHLGLI